MKKLVFFLSCLIALSVFTSCSKEKSVKNDPDNPQSVIPEELAGKWLLGEFNMKNFQNYNGTPQAGSTDAAIGYSFSKDGRAEQFIYYRFDDGSDREVLAYRKGTVTFDNATKTLKFVSTQGNYRLFENGKKTQGNFDAEDLHPGYAPEYNNVYLEQDSQKTTYLFCQNDEGEDLSFKKTNW